MRFNNILINHYLPGTLMLGALLFSACKKEDKRSNLSGITEFSIPSTGVDFTVDQTTLKISNADSLPFESDVSALTASFTAVAGATVKIGSVVQQSGATVNDYTNPVVYTVVAEDGVTTRQYTVQVNVAKLDPKTVSWQRSGEAGFGSFHDVQAGFFNGKFYAVNSTLGSFNAFTFGVFESADGVAWTRLKAADNNNDSIPMAEHGKLVTGFNNKMWMLGGLLPGTAMAFSAVTNKVWSSADGVTWTVSAPADPADRWSIRERINAVVFNNKMWVIGGSGYPAFGNTNSNGTAYNDVWNTTDGATWTKITDAADFLPRSNPAVFVYKDKIWLIGGIDNGRNYLNDVWNSADGLNWTQVTTASDFTARQGHRVVAHNGQLLLIGGETADGTQADLWVSEDDGVNWTKVEAGDVRALPGNFPARAHFSAFVNENVIWLMGGLMKNGNQHVIVSDIWKGGLN